MIQLTKRTEYGLLALVRLAEREGEVVSAREIAEHYPIPKRLLAEVLKDLGHAQVVESHRGANGGYSLARRATSITVGEVVAALEGAPSLASCEAMEIARNGSCDVEPNCPIKSPIQQLKADLWALLERTTLSDLGRSQPAPSPETATSIHERIAPRPHAG